VDDEADTAGIVLVLRVVEAVSRTGWIVLHSSFMGQVVAEAKRDLAIGSMRFAHGPAMRKTVDGHHSYDGLSPAVLRYGDGTIREDPA
jgi:hypothetical protein